MQSTKKFESPFSFLSSDVVELNIQNSMPYDSLNGDVDRNFKFDYKIISNYEKDGARYGGIALTFQAVVQKMNKNIMELRAVIHGHFTAGINFVNAEEFGQLLEYNGVTALYGISRGILTSISSIAFTTEVVRLPMLNIGKVIESKHKAENSNE